VQQANLFQTLLTLGISLTILCFILTARGGRQLFIRRIPGLSAVDEAVGRATEMGRPILFSISLGGIDVDTLLALSVGQHVARLAARYGTRMILPVVEPSVFPVAQEICREAWAAEGKIEAYRPDDIRFLSGQQFAYAAGVMGLINREQCASIFYFGYFYAEALLLAENGQEVGAIQVAGTPATTQIPFFLVSCDYTVIGDEYYAASAYLSREPTLLGSLVGQDIGKLVLGAVVLVGACLSLWYGTTQHLLTQWARGW